MDATLAASVWRQWGALFYDLLICIALAGLVSTVWVAANNGEALPSGHWGLQGSLILVVLSYFLVSDRFLQQTIGMRAWSLLVVRSSDGGRPGTVALLLRFLLAPLATAALGANYICAALRQDGRSIADLGSGTTVVYRPA